MICGALKLVCFIVTACWDRCFPPAHHKPREDPCEIIPCEFAIVNIFSFFNLHELGKCRPVSKKWNMFASTPNFWKAVIYREAAFSSKNWAQWDADLVKGVDMSQEMLSLPNNIAEELRRLVFPGKSIRETHVLIRYA